MYKGVIFDDQMFYLSQDFPDDQSYNSPCGTDSTGFVEPQYEDTNDQDIFRRETCTTKPHEMEEDDNLLLEKEMYEDYPELKEVDQTNAFAGLELELIADSQLDKATTNEEKEIAMARKATYDTFIHLVLKPAQEKRNA